MKNLNGFLVLLCTALVTISCSMKATQSQSYQIDEGTYAAVINPVNMDESLRVYAEISQVFLSFEPDNKFVYQVRAMGNEMDDEGKWEVRGDSLYIFDLGRGPNTAFKLNDLGDGQFELIGPNHFVLSKTDQVIAPLKQ